MHLLGAEVDYSDSRNLSSPLSTPLVLLLPQKLHHLSFKFTDNPSSIHLLALLLSANTVTLLYLRNASVPESHAYLDDSLLPLLMQLASKLQEFTFQADMDDTDEDDIDSDFGGPTSKAYCFHLGPVLPLLLNCTHLTLPASSIPYPTSEDACFLINPSSLPVLSHLLVLDNDDCPDAAITYWAPLIRARGGRRGGRTLVDIEFSFNVFDDPGPEWTLLETLCRKRGADLHDTRRERRWWES